MRVKLVKFEEIFITGDFVYKLDGRDLDEGQNGQIEYTWTGGQSDR